MEDLLKILPVSLLNLAISIISIILAIFIIVRLFRLFRQVRMTRRRKYAEISEPVGKEAEAFRESDRKLQSDLHSEDNPPRFSALYPTYIVPERWYTMLIYIWLPRAIEDARRDFQVRKELLLEEYTHSSTTGTDSIRHDTEITIVPELTGCRFNPPQRRVIWLEDWHCIDFRMQVKLGESNSNHNLNKQRNGRIAFYVGPILIAETEIQIEIIPNTAESFVTQRRRGPIQESFTPKAYRNIFVSYSHKDTDIVTKLEKAYMILGDRYLRDVNMLRSGQEWNSELLHMIDIADVFQLCWSHSAKQSRNVEEEWHYAYELDRTSFIRPIYWEIPMPDPPLELSSIHFAYLEI